MTAQDSAERGTGSGAGSASGRTAETSVETPATMKPGLGYPNDRVETSPTPIGWHGLDNEEIENVSRETSTGGVV